MTFTEKERLLRALGGESTDRPPVISPGGMMSALTVELLAKHGLDGAAINEDADAMARAAVMAREETGLENLGVPFCLTGEAQACGAQVSTGTRELEPMLITPALPSTRDIENLKVPDPAADPRLAAMVGATRRLKDEYPEVPVIGNVTGPVTLAASLVEFDAYARLIFRQPALARKVADESMGLITALIRELLAAGADVITVSDPTASGDILGPNSFGFFLGDYQAIFTAIREVGARSILHICGDTTPLLSLIAETRADALSVDSVTPPARAGRALEDMRLVGNVSTRLLGEGTPEGVAAAVRRLLAEGIDVVAPGCGLDRGTPLANIRAMTMAVKEAHI